MKRVAAMLKRRELYFVILVYPGLLFFLSFVKNAFEDFVKANQDYYGYLTFTVFIFVILCFILEVGMKLYGYGLQGDKLKLRQQEGVHVKDMSNGN